MGHIEFLRLGHEHRRAHRISELRGTLVVLDAHHGENWTRIREVFDTIRRGRGAKKAGAHLAQDLKRVFGPDADEYRAFKLWLAAVHEEEPYTDMSLTAIAERMLEQPHLIRDMLPYVSLAA